MGRPRKSNPSNLPSRVYEKHGSFHYIDKEGKWHKLGANWDREAKEKWAALSSGTAVEGSVAALLDTYLDHLAARLEAGKLSPRQHADRQVDAGRLKLFFGTMECTKVTQRHVALYLERRTDKHGNHAPIRANREVALLSASYEYAKGKFVLANNPCLGVPRNPENVRERYVEHWERRQFAKRCCPDWLRAYLLLKYLTGLRMGDMLRLNRADETTRGLRVRIGKSRKRKVLEFRWTWALRRTVGFIHRTATSTRGSHTDADAPVSSIYYFRTGQGTPLTTAGFKSAWRRAMKPWKDEGQEPFWEHDIRAKTASDSLTAGDAQERLAHDSIKTTNRHYMRGVKKVTPLR
jgi:integrase